MKNFLYSILAVVGLAFASVGFAQDSAISYTYLQGSYDYNTTTSTHGLGLDGSLNLGPSPFFVEGSVNRFSDSLLTGGVDSYRAGGGLHVEFLPSISAYGTVGVVHVAAGYPTNFRSYGYDFDAGVRFEATDRIQLKVGAQEEKLNAADTQYTLYGVGEVLFKVTNNVGLVADYKGSNSDHAVSAGVRLSF